MFVENTPVQLAWGMKNLFYNVQPYDFPRMRHELEEHFGSHSTYYRYWNGQRTITPDDQSWITALFNRYGYEKPGPYNRTTIAYHFPI